MTTPTPTPLPASSRILRRRRVEAWVGERLPDPNPEGRARQTDTARFATLDDAKLWAERTHPDAGIVRFTGYAESTGWRPQPLGLS